MLTLIATALLLAAPAAPRHAKKALATRCGWLDNPTPGNFFLRDHDGEWILAEQGGYQAKGLDLIPDLSGDEFVEVNGPHGYACACLKISVDVASKRVLEIASVQQKLLKVCLEDPGLKPMPR